MAVCQKLFHHYLHCGRLAVGGEAQQARSVDTGHVHARGVGGLAEQRAVKVVELGLGHQLAGNE